MELFMENLLQRVVVCRLLLPRLIDQRRNFSLPNKLTKPESSISHRSKQFINAGVDQIGDTAGNPLSREAI
jgi:hypothetical protein